MENITFTENGDKALSTSGNFCLDFFTRITRSAVFTDYITAFTKAWSENPQTAIKILMNMRDIRNGKGEKHIPAVLMLYIKYSVPENIYENLARQMVTYGYWKDLLKIMEFECRSFGSKKVKLSQSAIEVKLFAEQLDYDYKIFQTSNNIISSPTKPAISLCAKWAPSRKTHYNHHPMFIADSIMAVMNLKTDTYRKMLSCLRGHLNILERLMSQGKFDQIDFSKIPSVAHMKAKPSFMRDTNANGVESEARKKLHQSYSEYLKKLAEGKTKVNIVGIQPHELVSKYLGKYTERDELTESQWLAIVDRVKKNGIFRNTTAVVDVSGSMIGQPMEVAIALGLIVSDCTTGPFHGQIITFHDNPSWHHIIGSSLKEKVSNLKSAPWGGSTNLRKTFDMILQHAKSASLSPDEMVKTLFIFTDMQFNECCGRFNESPLESTFEYAKRTYEEAGYQLPRIVCWNLRTSNSKTMPVPSMEKNYIMLSGFSAELLKYLLSAAEFNPEAIMQYILQSYVLLEPLVSVTGPLVFRKNLADLEKGVNASVIKKSFKSKTVALSKSNSSSDSCYSSDSC